MPSFAIKIENKIYLKADSYFKYYYFVQKLFFFHVPKNARPKTPGRNLGDC